MPGTAAYRLRAQDAVPDELEIIPDRADSGQASSQKNNKAAKRPAEIQVPKTVVEKVDLASPSHGDVPGTESYEKRMADAVPDVILQAPPHGHTSTDTPAETKQANVPIPTTVITKVDSKPSHGEVSDTDAYNIRTMDAKPDKVVEKGDATGKFIHRLVPSSERLTESGRPTSSLNRSSYLNHSGRRSSLEGTYPIAADGGFGPMDYDEDGVNDGHCDENQQNGVDTRAAADDENAAFGDDFDDFEEGAAADDFGDFDDGVQKPTEPELEPEDSPMLSRKAFPSSESPFVSRAIFKMKIRACSRNILDCC